MSRCEVRLVIALGLSLGVVIALGLLTGVIM